MASRGRKMQPPCEPKALSRCLARHEAVFGIPAAKDFARLLAVADGILFNGVEVYGSTTRPSANTRGVKVRGIFEVNALLRRDGYEDAESMVYYGENDLYLFGFGLDARAYVVQARGGDHVESPKTFAALIERAFRDHLPD
jgi:hypothetical protein